MQKFPIYAHSWVNFARLIIFGPAAREERHDKQQYYRARHRGQQRAERPHSNPAPQSYEPAAQKASYNADNQIDNKSCAAASDNHIGYPSRDKTNDQVP